MMLQNEMGQNVPKDVKEEIDSSSEDESNSEYNTDSSSINSASNISEESTELYGDSESDFHEGTINAYIVCLTYN